MTFDDYIKEQLESNAHFVSVAKVAAQLKSLGSRLMPFSVNLWNIAEFKSVADIEKAASAIDEFNFLFCNEFIEHYVHFQKDVVRIATAAGIRPPEVICLKEKVNVPPELITDNFDIRQYRLREGFLKQWSKEDNPIEVLDMPVEKRERLLAYLRTAFIPTRTVSRNGMSSYGLKHLFEDELFYVTNGEFKGAMHLLGYRTNDPTERNCLFNISKRSPLLLAVKKRV